MAKVIINNTYKGYCESSDKFLYAQRIDYNDYPELDDIFKDLCQLLGSYKLIYKYDEKIIKIIGGYYVPFGNHIIKSIHRNWLDYNINKMSNWSYKKRIENCL